MRSTSTFIRLAALLLALAMVLTPVSAIAYDDEGNPVTVIVLDPGHGGIDSGTVAEHNGVTICESDLNLKIAQYCRQYLEETYINIRVLLTRESDEKVSLEDRMAIALENDADFMLSMHLNASTGSARGALAIVPAGNYRKEQSDASRETASAILEELAALGLTNRGFLSTYTDSTRYPDGSRKDGFMIIRSCVEAGIPGIIMEQAFLDNTSDYNKFLSSEEKLRAIGVANALGLARTLGLEEKKTPSSADLGDTPFTDVFPGDWYYDDVTYVWENGMMEGIDAETFGPAMTANRAMVVTLLYRLDGGTHSAQTPTFTDVPEGVWYYDPVEWAVENGITTGVSETEFAPGRNVIREQFVTFLYRYAAMLGCVSEIGSPADFTDADQISSYARDAVRWAAANYLVTGYEDGTFRPLRELNRAELAVLMHRFHRYLLHESGELVYDWTLSHLEQELYVGDSFELTLTNEYGETASVLWAADVDDVVQIDGSTVTAIGTGAALLTCELDGMLFDCLVIVTEKVHVWTISHTEQALYLGESFQLAVTDQFGDTAEVTWTADTEGVVAIDGSTITAVGIGSALLSCQLEDQVFDCLVTVTEKTDVWTISHTDVTITVGESFNLRLRNQDGETASVTWNASKSGYVTISGNRITGKAKGTVTVSCEWNGVTYSCIVRVKSA